MTLDHFTKQAKIKTRLNSFSKFKNPPTKLALYLQINDAFDITVCF